MTLLYDVILSYGPKTCWCSVYTPHQNKYCDQYLCFNAASIPLSLLYTTAVYCKLIEVQIGIVVVLCDHKQQLDYNELVLFAQ